jgi:predicted DCC family thiol-disulfide oxidoreductase YuxK
MSAMADSPNPLILYDGVCGLCNGFVRFVLKRDPADRFRFAALQSEVARTALQKHQVNLQSLETVCLLLDHGQPTERILERSSAAIDILRGLGPNWRILASLLAAFPHGFRDWCYNLIARHRYRVFGKYDVCPLPREEDRRKFLDLQTPSRPV